MKVGSGAAAAWREGGREGGRQRGYDERGGRRLTPSSSLSLRTFQPMNVLYPRLHGRESSPLIRSFIVSSCAVFRPMRGVDGHQRVLHHMKIRAEVWGWKTIRWMTPIELHVIPPRTGSHLLTPLTFPVILTGAKGDCASIITSFLRHISVEKELWWGSETRPINIEQYRCQWHSKSWKG